MSCCLDEGHQEEAVSYETDEDFNIFECKEYRSIGLVTRRKVSMVTLEYEQIIKSKDKELKDFDGNSSESQKIELDSLHDEL